jgi:hypothetical protein
MVLKGQMLGPRGTNAAGIGQADVGRRSHLVDWFTGDQDDKTAQVFDAAALRIELNASMWKYDIPGMNFFQDTITRVKR